MIGLAAGVAGTKLFRWEAGRRPRVRALVGGRRPDFMGGSRRHRLGNGPVAARFARSGSVDQYHGGADRGNPALTVCRATTISSRPGAAHSGPGTSRANLPRKLASWPQGKLDDSGQSIRNLVSVAAVADLCADPRESEIARLVFRQISSGFEPAVARQALAWIILSPEDGQALTKAPELGLFRHPPERLVRQRSVIYAQKYLGRLLGKIPD